MATEHELKLLLSKCYYALNVAGESCHGPNENNDNSPEEAAQMYFDLCEEIFNHMP